MKPSEPIGLPAVDRLVELEAPNLHDYITAVSEYVRNSRRLSSGQSKAAQIRLSGALARVLAVELVSFTPSMSPVAGEREVSGALRIAKADISEDPCVGRSEVGRRNQTGEPRRRASDLEPLWRHPNLCSQLASQVSICRCRRPTYNPDL